MSESNKKLTVSDGCFIGKKWFLKIPYKTIETDVKFNDDAIYFFQGSGFASCKNNKTKTVIRYDEISIVTASTKISAPNITFAVICGLLALFTQIWAILVIAVVVLFLGTTAVTVVSLENGLSFEVPTEFKSEAEELQLRITTAVKQAKGGI